MLSPDVTTLRRFLDDGQRRLRGRALLEGAAAGLAIAALLTLLGWPSRNVDWRQIAVACVLAALGAILRLGRARLSHAAVAREVEAGAPECRNLLITAAEISTAHGKGYVDTLVHQRAATLTGSLSISRLLPLRRQWIVAAAALVLWVASAAWHHEPIRSAVVPSLADSPVPSLTALDVEVVPPAYSGRAAKSFTDPARISMLQGSRVRIRGRAHAQTVAVETLEGIDSLPVPDGSSFAGETSVSGDGFVALTPISRDGVAGVRRLIGVTVVPDAPPRVRITTPGRDLGVPDGNRSIAVSIEASDDLGLATLTLRAVTVAGSGERFTFREQEIPVVVERRDPLQWKAKATLALAPLGLEPGDMVVYRAIVTDQRPGATPVESDAWIVEVLSPGSIAAEGFAIDPEQDRYALSQQMVILKTERLLAKRATLSAEAFADSAAEVAVEQRRVRAEFVFMMGGEVEDEHGHEGDPNELNEVAEAEAEDELLAGRLQNAGRIAILRGIRFMSRADLLLNTANVADALVAERRALVEIEKAFARSRIILRALTQREQLDLTRRLTGVLDSAVGGRELPVVAAADAWVGTMRGVLRTMAALRVDSGRTAARAAGATALAETVLRSDAANPAAQDVARLLSTASTAMAARRPAEADALLDSASVRLSRLVGGRIGRTSMRPTGVEAARLRGALMDVRRPRGTP